MSLLKYLAAFAVSGMIIIFLGFILVSLFGDRPFTWMMLGAAGATMGFIAGSLDD